MVEWKKIKELFDIRNGYTPSTKDESFWTGGNIPWFKMEDIRENGSVLNDSNLHITEKAIKGKGPFKANSIILATSATIGEHALITVDHLSNQRFTNFYPKKEFEEFVNMKFIYYYMFIVDEWCKQHTHQGGFASVDMEGLYKLLIPMPSLSEQNRIVGILDTFTASIDNLKEQIAQRRKQYEYYRDQLLDLEGKDIEEVLSFGNDFQLKARIGWQGLTKKEYKETGDYKLVTGTDFTRNLRIDFDNCVYVDKERYEQDEYIQLKVGDVLITKDGTLGKVAYIDILEKPATLNGGVFVVRDPKNRVLPKFLMFYLTSYHFKKWMQQNHTTGSIQHLTQKLLSSFTIPVFSLEEQQHIVEILDKFEASIQNLEAQLSQREKQYEYYRNKLLTFE
jgi:type I restriction enzyme S subunit